MRKNVKRMLAVFLAVIMICGGFVMAPMNTMAATTYTVTNEAELKEALANAKDGDVINVGRRFDPTIEVIEIKEPIEITKDLTINMYTNVRYWYNNEMFPEAELLPESIIIINSCDVIISGDLQIGTTYTGVYGYKLIDENGDVSLTIDSRGSMENGILIVDNAANNYISKLMIARGEFCIPDGKTTVFEFYNGSENVVAPKENISVTGGCFEESIAKYVGENTVIYEKGPEYVCRYEVRSTIMSEGFASLLTDGKIIVPSVVPNDQMVDGVKYLIDYLCMYETEEVSYYPTYIRDGIFDISAVNKMTGEQIEIHRVEVEFNPDAIKKPEPQLVIPETNIAGSGFVDDAETVFKAIPFTEEEKAQIEAGAEVTITLEMKDITDTVSDEERKLVEEKLKEDGMQAAIYMDVRIVAQTEREKPRNVPTVDILKLRTSSMPDILGLKDEVNVYHVGRDGVEVVPSRYNRNNNTIEFDANSFSTYALAYKDVAKVPQTGDSTSVAVWMMLLAVGGCAILLSKKVKMN